MSKQDVIDYVFKTPHNTNSAILNQKLDELVEESGGGGGSVPAAGGVTTLHINITAVNQATMEATFTADKTPLEMQQASAIGPTWCVVSFAAGILGDKAVSGGVPPAWCGGGAVAFGSVTESAHNDNGSNKTGYAVMTGRDGWLVDLTKFSG